MGLVLATSFAVLATSLAVKKILNKNNLGRKQGRVYSVSHFKGILRPVGKGMVAGSLGSWQYCCHNPESEREKDGWSV